jgi:hypothetical protein
MPKTAEPWSLTSLRERLIKIGAKVTSHGRYVTFQMAAIAVPRQMFVEILSLIARLRALACASMREQSDQMRQATTAKACNDLARSARFTVPVLSTAGFNRTLLVLSAICRCPSPVKGTILAPKPRESGECLLNARHLDYQRLEVWN